MHSDDRHPAPANTIRDLEPPEALDDADVRGGGLADIGPVLNGPTKPPPPVGGILGVLVGQVPPPPPPPPA